MGRSDPCVGAIVLAAGQSRRMGGNKLRMLVAGKPVVRHSVDAINAALAEPAIVVTGHDADAVTAALAGARASTVHAADFDAGMAQSLRAGIIAVPAHWDAALVCLGDMPLVSEPLIRAMAQLAKTDRIIVPYTGGTQRNPVLWGRSFFAQLTTLTGDRGAKAVLADWPNHIVQFNWPRADDFRDVDTPGALAAVRVLAVARVS